METNHLTTLATTLAAHKGRSETTVAGWCGARKLHVSDVTVRKWVRQGPGARDGDDRQLPLF